jgi:hypothetical protein
VVPTFHITISGTVTAAYAAVVSTFTAIVQIFNYRRDRSRIKLTARYDQMMYGGGDPKYRGEVLTIVYVENHGRRPVTITTVGARCLHPDYDLVICDVQPPLPHELTEGKKLAAILPANTLDISRIDLWEASDAVGRIYALKVASWRKRFISTRKRKAEWRREAGEKTKHKGEKLNGD